MCVCVCVCLRRSFKIVSDVIANLNINRSLCVNMR